MLWLQRGLGCWNRRQREEHHHRGAHGGPHEEAAQLIKQLAMTARIFVVEQVESYLGIKVMRLTKGGY
jgi:hypothetical protein